MKRVGPALCLAGLPPPALAHDAFGDLGPFYASLLHPLADLGQGLLVVAFAVLLARQPLPVVRLGWLALVLAGLAAVVASGLVGTFGPNRWLLGLVVAALGVLAVLGRALPPLLGAVVGAIVGLLAGSAVDLQDSQRDAALGAVGTTLGIAVLSLLVWSAVDFGQRRIGRVAGTVVASWIAAVGIMVAALPG